MTRPADQHIASAHPGGNRSCQHVVSTMEYYTGFPELTTALVGNNTVALTQGTTIVARTTQLGPTYGQASSIQRGWLIKAGFDISF